MAYSTQMATRPLEIKDEPEAICLSSYLTFHMYLQWGKKYEEILTFLTDWFLLHGFYIELVLVLLLQGQLTKAQEEAGTLKLQLHAVSRIVLAHTPVSAICSFLSREVQKKKNHCFLILSNIVHPN